MEYKGSCHCGQVKFAAEGELTEALSCNCSICQKKGSLLWFLPTNQVTFTLDSPDILASYTFNKHVINHHFCKNCGIHPYAQGNSFFAINVRCIDDIDLEKLKINYFDGRSV
ncbi:GFA family protein [Acinetobacter baumannii]|uniref:GFA family protein n=1 Tax=Acinetobacter baumannii TaxID=470 RepID=UPI0023405E38|nr:GFA family protein [Acinetobacter baumannii]MDC4776152.1 GFA family protein [Acinetobacter baumannii]MDV4327804.1 GFA family protein [Acinetobacter baumannii]